MSIKGIVLYAKDIEATRAFYESLGMTFREESHDGGPWHYSSQEGTLLLEIYPGKRRKSDCMPLIQVESIDDVLQEGHTLIRAPEEGTAILEDPDGRQVYLTETWL